MRRVLGVRFKTLHLMARVFRFLFPSSSDKSQESLFTLICKCSLKGGKWRMLHRTSLSFALLSQPMTFLVSAECQIRRRQLFSSWDVVSEPLSPANRHIRLHPKGFHGLVCADVFVEGILVGLFWLQMTRNAFFQRRLGLYYFLCLNGFITPSIYGDR